MEDPKLANKKVFFTHLGLIDYKVAWDLQAKHFDQIIEKKLANRNADISKKEETENYLFFCEHPHVYTLGKSGSPQHLLIDQKKLKENNISFYQNNRGGDITYHGPGQIVGYPILDLDNFFTDIHKYLRYLEEAVILTLEEYHIKAGRINGLTGVWIGHEQPGKARKICAMGVKLSRWVTMHGFAFNVNTDLNYFNHIVPCGITDKAVTSLEQELGYREDMSAVENKLLKHLSNLFEMRLIR